MGAPTRLRMVRKISRSCSWWFFHTRTRSPGTTCWAGLTAFPLSFTCPARTASAASPRVLNIRTAHTQASMRTGRPSVSAVVFVDNLLNLYPIGNATDDSHDQTEGHPEPEATSEHKCGKHAATKPSSNRDDTIACVLAYLLLFHFDGIIGTGLHCHGVYPSRLIALYSFHPLGASFFRLCRGLCEPSDEIKKCCFLPWGHG